MYVKHLVFFNNLIETCLCLLQIILVYLYVTGIVEEKKTGLSQMTMYGILTKHTSSGKTSLS
jgi:hypothetical protein